MDNYNKEKRIVESYEDFIQNRNESLNEGVLDWSRDIKDKVVAWLRGVKHNPKNQSEKIDPHILFIANRIVNGGRVSEDDYILFMEETGMIDKIDTSSKNITDRYFHYDEMLELVLDNMERWSARGSRYNIFDRDSSLMFNIIWDFSDWEITRIDSEQILLRVEGNVSYHSKDITLSVRGDKKNIYRLDESSPKSIFEYYSYGLDTETLRRFCKDISEQAPEKEYSTFSPFSPGYNLLSNSEPK